MKGIWSNFLSQAANALKRQSGLIGKKNKAEKEEKV